MGEYADDAIERDFDMEFCRDEDESLDDLDDHDRLEVMGNRRRNRTSHVPEYSYLEFECVLKQSDKAWLIRFPNNAGQAWFPKSQCKVDMRERILSIPDWLRNEKVKEFAIKKIKEY